MVLTDDTHRFSSHGGCVADVRFGATTHGDSPEVLQHDGPRSLQSIKGCTQSKGTEETHQCQVREVVG